MIPNIIIKKFNFNKNVIMAIIEKDGQCNPNTSDNVQIKLSLNLPCVKNNDDEKYCLNNDLQFEDRCVLFNERLYSHWGIYCDKFKTRYHSKTFDAKTWKQASAKAEKYLKSELIKLEKVIKKRKIALINA